MRAATSARIPAAVALATISLASGGVAQEVPFDPAEFDAYVAAAVETWEAPGFAVAIVQDGKTIFERGYGVLELGGSAAANEHTRFAIGSTTKAMTAAALGMLVEEGKLLWDDPVTKHLPDFQLHDPYVTREVTVRDLLTHRAGLGNADVLWYEQDTTSDEIMSKVRYIEPAYSFRSSFIYQNIMYLAAGRVLEAVSGMSWAGFIRSRIFEPLGMTETLAALGETIGQPNVAVPHDYVDGELVSIENASVDPVAPAGAVWSSVHDMAKWLAMLLAEGETASGDRVLCRTTVDELFTPQVVLRGQYPADRLTSPHFLTYGLAWFQKDYRGRKIDYHTGSIDGMVALAALDRDRELGVYVLGNRDHVELRHAIMYRVLDLFDPEGEPRDWSAELKTLYDEIERGAEQARQAQRASRVEGTVPSRPLGEFAGTYSDPLFGTVTVRETDGGLRFLHGARRGGSMEHWHYDTFLVRFDARWRGEMLVTFRQGAGGRTSGIDLGGAVLARTGGP